MKRNSKKGFTLVEIMIVVVIIGLLAAMAIPAFQKVRATSQGKAITNNLRQLSSAAQQYFLEHGVSSVDYTELVGSGKYISAVKAVNGEEYATTFATIDSTDTQLSINDTDGTTHEFDY